MRVYYILFVVLIHRTAATVDLQGLKDTAATKLQTITDTATTSLLQFADTIDFEKVQKLDILNLIPKLQTKGQLLLDTYEKIPEYRQRVKFYLDQIKGLTGQDLVLAFEAPWPAKKSMESYGYY